MSKIQEIRDCDVRIAFTTEGKGTIVVDGVELAAVVGRTHLSADGRSAVVSLQLAVDNVTVDMQVDVTSLVCTARVTGNTVQLLQALVAPVRESETAR